jgi:CO/xanthine dehydrogenase FAD-binding subunit
MIPPFDYKIPDTVEEATRLLWEANGKAKVIAGGTDLVLHLRNGNSTPQFLIDITNIPEFRGIDQKDGLVSIGAAVTHSEIASSPLVKRDGRVLSDAASHIGSPQIRHLGTIGGNLIHASPAADTIPPLMVLNAFGRIVSKEGMREIPLSQLFKGPYQTRLKPHEILVQLSFPKLPSGAQCAFVRLARREAMAIARMSVAIVLKIEKRNGFIEDIRVSLGSVTPIPQRMYEAEAALMGRLPDEESLQGAAHEVSKGMIQQTGIRSSTSYKAPVVEALFVRAFKKALEGPT